MTYAGGSSVQTETWIRIGADAEICYEVSPAVNDVEFTLGDRDVLTLNMGEAGLRRCVAAFTDALDAFGVKQPAQSEGSG